MNEIDELWASLENADKRARILNKATIRLLIEIMLDLKLQFLSLSEKLKERKLAVSFEDKDQRPIALLAINQDNALMGLRRQTNPPALGFTVRIEFGPTHVSVSCFAHPQENGVKLAIADVKEEFSLEDIEHMMASKDRPVSGQRTIARKCSERIVTKLKELVAAKEFTSLLAVY